MNYRLPGHADTTVENYIGTWSRDAIVNPSLSIRCMFNGSADYHLEPRRSLLLDDRSYLVLNEGQVYGVNKSSAAPVESFCIFFPSTWVGQLSTELNLTDQQLLDDPCQVAAASIQFRDHTRTHDYAISPYLLYLRDNARPNGYSDDFEAEEILLGLLKRLFLAEPLTLRSPDKLGAQRRSTREELHKRLCHARDFMDANLPQRFSLQDAATAASLSPFHFLRTFRQIFGRTPNTYVVDRRVQKARRLLTRTDDPILEIALEVGYESHPTFARVFKSHTGFSPRGFRRAFRTVSK